MLLPSNYQPRFDAAESAFIERSLLYIEAETYNTLLPPTEMRMYVPVDNTDPPGAKFTAYRQYTRVGAARLITSGGQDIPNVSLFVKEFQKQYYPIGAGYQYDYLDLLAAAMAAENGGPPLNIDLEGSTAAYEAIERGLDAFGAVGSDATDFRLEVMEDVGIRGLLNHPNATLFTVPVGVALGTAWSTKTPDEVIADMVGIVAAQIDGTFKVHKPNTMLLPVAQYEQQMGRPMGDGRSDTVLSYFMKTNKHIKEVDSWVYLKRIGAGNTDRMVVYDKNKRMCRHKINMEFTQLPPQLEGMNYKVACLAKSAGVVIPYPLSVSYGDGI